ncbi:MAG TPA: PEGA domain-containing protein [Polyangia bacterium]
MTLPPPRRGGTAAVLGGVGLLAAVGGLAIYAGLSGSTPMVTTPGGAATPQPTIVAAAVFDAARPEDLARIAEAPSDLATAVAENAAKKPPTALTPSAPTPSAPTGAPGTFAVGSTPDGAAVFVDGEPRGTTPAQIELAPGRHSFVVLGEGEKMAQQTVVVAAGGRLDVLLEPAKLPAAVAGSAGLKVRCKSHGELRIFVDGADSGRTCPNEERISVAPGPHKIGLFSARTGEMHESEHEVTEGNNSTRVYVKY